MEQLGLEAAYGVLDTLDLATRCEAEVCDAEDDVMCEKDETNNYVRSVQRRCHAVRRAGTKRAGTAKVRFKPSLEVS